MFIEGGWVGFAAYNAGTGILSVATDVKCPAGQAGDVHAAALCAAQENVARVLCQTTHLSALKDALAQLMGAPGVIARVKSCNARCALPSTW